MVLVLHAIEEGIFQCNGMTSFMEFMIAPAGTSQMHRVNLLVLIAYQLPGIGGEVGWLAQSQYWAVSCPGHFPDIIYQNYRICPIKRALRGGNERVCVSLLTKNINMSSHQRIYCG